MTYRLWALVALALSCASAQAAITTTSVSLSSSAWTDLGVGPMQVGGTGLGIAYQIGSSQPALGSSGVPVAVGGPPATIPFVEHVWAFPLSSGAAALVTIAPGDNTAFIGAVAMTVGQSYAAQRSVGVLATVGGNVTVVFADASTLTLPVSPGWQTFPFAVTQISASTATATYYNMK